MSDAQPMRTRWILHGVVLFLFAAAGGLVAAFEATHGAGNWSGLRWLLTRAYFAVYAIVAIGTTGLLLLFPKHPAWPFVVYVCGVPLILLVAYYIAYGIPGGSADEDSSPAGRDMLRVASIAHARVPTYALDVAAHGRCSNFPNEWSARGFRWSVTSCVAFAPSEAQPLV